MGKSKRGKQRKEFDTMVLSRFVLRWEKSVNWSAGQLEEFSAEEFGSYDLLQYIADSTSNLKCIRLIKSRVSEKELEKIIKRWPLLEEIELTSYWYSPELCQAIGLLCPRLKHFRLNQIHIGCGFNEKNLIANCIGRTMANLRSLQLIGNRMTKKGLHAILEGCPQLKSLDVRNCENLTINRRIQRELERIKILRLPNDSTEDYKFAHHFSDFSPSCGPFCRCFEPDSDNDSDTETYFDIKYGHIMFQHWD